MKSKIIAITILLLYSCGQRESIKIGYISNLSGRQSELGIRGRDGVIMAIDEANTLGRIDKRELELIVKDHKGDKNLCYNLTRELINEGVEVIIGPMVSSMAQPVIEATKGTNILIVSPTVSTDRLKDIDDNFLRLIPSSSRQGRALGSVISSRKEEKVAVVYDGTNSVYALGVIDGLEESLGKSSDKLYFTSKKNIPDVISKLTTMDFDALLLISTGIDAAQIIQNLGKVKPLPSLYGSSWVKLSNIANHGGKVIDNMIVTDSYKSSIKSERELDFNKRFNSLFNLEPTLPGVYSYESAKLFIDIKRENPKKSGLELKEPILLKSYHTGISDNFSFNKYGDVVRKQSILEIIGGEYRIYGEY